MKLKKKNADHDHSNKYITTQELNKLMSENVASRLEEANLASKNDIVNFVKKRNFDYFDKTKFALLKNKLKKLQTFDSSLFISQNYFHNDVQLYLILQMLCYIS